MIGGAVTSIAVTMAAIDESAGANRLAKVASGVHETPKRRLSTADGETCRFPGRRSRQWHSVPKTASSICKGCRSGYPHRKPPRCASADWEPSAKYFGGGLRTSGPR